MKAMPQHAHYRYSVTIHTDDRALLGCFRALAQHCQRTGNVRIPWGGTKDEDWTRDQHCVTFRFTTPAYRQALIDEANRLFPLDLWKEERRSDTDPARPQAHKHDN
jgi:hypothetical protein